MAKTRTFIAVAAEGEVHAAAQTAIDRLQSAAENVKWVAPENLHWTLHFLGDLDDVEVAAVCRRTLEAANLVEPFLLTAQGVSAFPKVERPRTLYLGAGQGSDELIRLHGELESRLADLGFRGERRRFVPHLTLGRVGRGSHGGEVLAERVAKLSNYEGGQMEVAEATVFASELGPAGPMYHVLATAPLGGD